MKYGLLFYSFVAAIFLLIITILFFTGNFNEGTGLAGCALAAYYMILYGTKIDKNE